MDRWVRSLRHAKTPRSSDTAVGLVHERERRPGGTVVDATTVFLAGAECPFSCVFCDLWTHTLTERTPPGALSRQLTRALSTVTQRSLIKLYNASNFFDPSAVPPEDEGTLLRLLDDFAQVTVECHPRFIGDRCFAFADRLEGALEIAVGLETVHPDALPRLNKQMTLADFDAAASALASRKIGLRAFVLLGCPFVPAEAQLDWTLRSISHAAANGAGTISIIPVRGGNGALESLHAEGHWNPVSLHLVEEAFDHAVRLGLDNAVVQVDLWDLKRVSDCADCLDARLTRLVAMNLSGLEESRVACDQCGASDRPGRP
jgi:hypothetical protein